VLRGVGSKAGSGRGSPGATLVKHNQPVGLGIEKAAIARPRPIARPSMKQYGWDARRVAGLFIVEAVTLTYIQPTGIKGISN
jgi:hypothetical protein